MIFYLSSIATIGVSFAVYKIFSLKQWRDLENWVKGFSKSLQMAPFDRPYTTFYWLAIYSSILYRFRVWRWIVSWPWNLGSVCLLAVPWVQLSVSADNGWPHNALQRYWLMPMSCHFRYCKALLVTSLTHVSGAIASVQTFTFTLGSLKIIGNATIRKLGYGFISPCIVPCIISERKRDIGQKSQFFHTPFIQGPFGGSQSENCHNVWHKKTTMVGLPEGKKVWGYVQRCRHNTGVWRADGQTDWQTDWQTDNGTSCDSIVRAMHTRQAVKMKNYNSTLGIC